MGLMPAAACTRKASVQKEGTSERSRRTGGTPDKAGESCGGHRAVDVVDVAAVDVDRRVDAVVNQSCVREEWNVREQAPRVKRLDNSRETHPEHPPSCPSTSPAS